jgi:hypothetical protein
MSAAYLVMCGADFYGPVLGFLRRAAAKVPFRTLRGLLFARRITVCCGGDALSDSVSVAAAGDGALCTRVRTDLRKGFAGLRAFRTAAPMAAATSPARSGTGTVGSPAASYATLSGSEFAMSV